VQWASVPLAVAGPTGAIGFVGRYLRAWAVALVAGVALGLATGWFPADRFVTFGFVVPILAALGLVRVLGWFGPRRTLGVAVTCALTLAMLAGAFIAWNRQEPFLSEDEVHVATLANSLIARIDDGVPLVFLVNEPDTTVTFLATRAGNVIRAAVPPDRIREVVIVVPSNESGGLEREMLERLTAVDRRASEAASGHDAETFVLTPFDEVDTPQGANVIRPGEAPIPEAGPVEPLEPSSRGPIALSSVLVLALVSIAGYGWARVVTPDRTSALAVSPALGASALVLFAIALERIGVPIEGPDAWAVSALAGGSGYLVWRVLERRAATGSAPQVEEKPA
jgi:hypothetical protein